MIPKVNLHTHTTFCDGKDSVEAMVQVAIEKGFTALGFSGHSFTAFDQEYCMTIAGTEQYLAEIARVKALYEGRLAIYAGIEQDFYATYGTEQFEYALGSVHYVKKAGIYYPVDENPEEFQRGVREGFGGDVYAYTKAYYDTIAQFPKTHRVDFIGHFDLLEKFNADHRYFDPQDKRYWYEAHGAIEALIANDLPFEINTGGIYRGYCKEPYPSAMLLKEILRQGGRVMISSDSHNQGSLDFYFKEAQQLARDVGFRSVAIWTPKGWEEAAL